MDIEITDEMIEEQLRQLAQADEMADWPETEQEANENARLALNPA